MKNTGIHSILRNQFILNDFFFVFLFIYFIYQYSLIDCHDTLHSRLFLLLNK